MTYAQEGRINLDGSQANGAHPRGMSGGALFMMGVGGAGNAVAIPFLVGILTQYHNDVSTLVATRIAHFWNATPDLRISKAIYARIDA